MSDTQNVRKKNALNNPKLVLSAPCPTAKGKYSQLKWDIYNNSPRIIARTNDPSDMSPERGYGNITCGMDIPMFYAFLVLLEQAIKASGEFKAKAENFNHDFVGGKRSQEISHMTDLWVGKDKEGVVFVSVISKKEERPVIKFPFGPSDNRYHKIFHADGNPYSKAELSVLYAKAYLRILDGVMNNLIVTEFKEPTPFKPGQGGGNKGGYQKNYGGNSGGGYQKNNSYSSGGSDASDLGEEELPF